MVNKIAHCLVSGIDEHDSWNREILIKHVVLSHFYQMGHVPHRASAEGFADDEYNRNAQPHLSRDLHRLRTTKVRTAHFLSFPFLSFPLFVAKWKNKGKERKGSGRRVFGCCTWDLIEAIVS